MIRCPRQRSKKRRQKSKTRHESFPSDRDNASLYYAEISRLTKSEKSLGEMLRVVEGRSLQNFVGNLVVGSNPTLAL